MSTTLINKIFGQSLGTKWNPVTESQTQADSIEAAMKSMPTFVSDAADRDARFSLTPDPGSACFRADMGWVEYYYAARTGAGSADPGRIAGWYPVLGRLPSFEANTTTKNNIASGTITTLDGFQTVDRSTYGPCVYAGAGQWTLNLPGRWLMSVSLQYAAGTLSARRVAVSGSRTGTFAVQHSDSASAGYSHATGVYISSSASDQVSASFLQNSGSAMSITTTNYACQYLGPN